MKRRLVLSLLLPFGFLVSSTGFSQPDSLVDCFPLAVGNQWTYSFNHEYLLNIGAGYNVTTDSGRAVYTVLGRTDYPDSIVWQLQERRSILQRVQWVGGSRDSLIADSVAFNLVEMTGGRHQLYRQITDQGMLWSTVFPFMRDMTDTTQMFRYWRLDSTQMHRFVIRYPSPHPLVTYRFTVTRDSGMVSAEVFNAITFEGYERSHHHLVARTLTAIGGNAEPTIPAKIVLHQNYPNPFNPTTTIQYQIPNLKSQTRVTLKVFDLLGREVATLVNEEMQPGNHEVSWDASGMASGMYFYRLQTPTYMSTKRMVLVR